MDWFSFRFFFLVQRSAQHSYIKNEKYMYILPLFSKICKTGKTNIMQSTWIWTIIIVCMMYVSSWKFRCFFALVCCFKFWFNVYCTRESTEPNLFSRFCYNNIKRCSLCVFRWTIKWKYVLFTVYDVFHLHLHACHFVNLPNTSTVDGDAVLIAALELMSWWTLQTSQQQS